MSVRENVVKYCLEEEAKFSDGKKEHNDPQFRYVGEYWASIGLPIDGRTKYKRKKKNGKVIEYNPAWSSAFISYIARKAGAGDGFKYSQAHCHYVQDFVARPSLFKAEKFETYAVRVGDLVHAGREYAKRYDFEEAKGQYVADSFYPSHSDFVVRVTSKYAYTIGGNVRDDVSGKRLALDAKGRLKPRSVGGNAAPWICVLSLQD